MTAKIKNNRLIIVILVVVIAYLCNELLFKSKPESPLVAIKTGQLKGLTAVSRDNREYYEFLGIPYAKPPMDQLRYEPPQPAEKWKGILEANKFGSKCPQLDLLFAKPDGNEDCLFLNVFTPKLNKNKLLPTMVFFHGGIYILGSSTGYKADYFMDEDVVLVTVNYRLGSFGFLNTGDGVVRGNMGYVLCSESLGIFPERVLVTILNVLKDQNMALRWVQENIREFGGDPKQVTIFGESAGAASVHLHMISNMSKGLFSKALSQSGTALSPWTIWTEPAAQATRFGAKLGCPTENTQEMINCMKNVSMYDIMTAHQEVLVPLRDMITIFVPTIESGEVNSDTFLAEHPRDTLKSHRYNKVPWMAGANSEDGLIFSAAIIRNDTVRDIVYNDFESVMTRLILTKSDDEAARKIKDFYMPSLPELSKPSFTQLTNMFTDRSFFNGIHESANLQSSHSPVYLYMYSYRGDFRVANVMIAVKRKYPIILEFSLYLIEKFVTKYILRQELPWYGVGHADELGLLFHMPYLTHVSPNDKDYEMSKRLIKLWTQFASSAQDEKTSLEFLNVPWSPIDTKEPILKYLNISQTPAIIKDPLIERYKFWESLNLAPNS